MVLGGWLPYPYYYPYVTTIPNISNPGCENLLFNPLVDNCYFDYNSQPPYNSFDGSCHDPGHFRFNNISYCDRNPCVEKYDYCCYDVTPYQDPSCVCGFSVEILASNIPAIARNLDMNMLGPWGIIIINDVVWVANTGAGLLTRYNLTGLPLFPVVNIFGPMGNIGHPTGIAFNDNLFAFPITCGPTTLPSCILAVTRDGTINGYNLDIDPDNMSLLIDNSCHNSVYTGLAIVTICINSITGKNCGVGSACDTFLYATDFYNQRIDVYDGNLTKIKKFNFIDECSGDPIPEDYAPFNIVSICEFLYVLYAKQNPKDNQYEFPGRGHGYISIFTNDGKFVKRFASCGTLNSPWGLVLAPSWFGYPAGSIMVSNHDGIINVFGPCGKCLGNLADEFMNDICLDGLRGLTPNPNYDRIIYWSAATNCLRDAFIGTINSKFRI